MILLKKRSSSLGLIIFLIILLIGFCLMGFVQLLVNVSSGCIILGVFGTFLFFALRGLIQLTEVYFYSDKIVEIEFWSKKQKFEIEKNRIGKVLIKTKDGQKWSTNYCTVCFEEKKYNLNIHGIEFEDLCKVLIDMGITVYNIYGDGSLRKVSPKKFA